MVKLTPAFVVKEIGLNFDRSLILSFLYNFRVESSVSRNRSLNVIIVPLFLQINLIAFRLNKVQEFQKSVMILVGNVVNVHGLHLRHH